MYSDRVRETTESTGTGSLTLEGAVLDFQGFPSGETFAVCVHDGSDSWEIFKGTVTGTTLTRTLAYRSSGLNGAATGATNASPIVVTSTAHGLLTGDVVSIHDVKGNTAANGKFTITKVNDDSFSLDGSTGSGTYVSGGRFVQHVNFSAGVKSVFCSIPSDALTDTPSPSCLPLYDASSMLSTKGLTDSTGQLALNLIETAGAGNYVGLANSTGDIDDIHAPGIGSQGADTNIDFWLTAKGSGRIKSMSPHYFDKLTTRNFYRNNSATGSLTLSGSANYCIYNLTGDTTVTIDSNTQERVIFVHVNQGSSSYTFNLLGVDHWSGGAGGPVLGTGEDSWLLIAVVVTASDGVFGIVAGAYNQV